MNARKTDSITTMRVICARVKGQLEVLRGTMDQVGNDGSGVRFGCDFATGSANMR